MIVPAIGTINGTNLSIFATDASRSKRNADRPIHLGRPITGAPATPDTDVGKIEELQLLHALSAVVSSQMTIPGHHLGVAVADPLHDFALRGTLSKCFRDEVVAQGMHRAMFEANLALRGRKSLRQWGDDVALNPDCAPAFNKFAS